MLSQNLLEATLISELLAEQRCGPYRCPARDHHISAPLLLAGRAGNGHSRARGRKESYSLCPSPPPCLVNTGTSCHQGRVSPADGVRLGEMPSASSTDTAATVHLGGSVPSLLLSPSPPSSSSLFMQLPDSSSLPLPSALLLSPPHLALFNHHSLFLIFSQPLQCLAKKEGGAKVRGKSLNAARVIIGRGPEGPGSWGHVFLAQESWLKEVLLAHSR